MQITSRLPLKGWGPKCLSIILKTPSFCITVVKRRGIVNVESFSAEFFFPRVWFSTPNEISQLHDLFGAIRRDSPRKIQCSFASGPADSWVPEKMMIHQRDVYIFYSGMSKNVFPIYEQGACPMSYSSHFLSWIDHWPFAIFLTGVVYKNTKVPTFGLDESYEIKKKAQTGLPR